MWFSCRWRVQIADSLYYGTTPLSVHLAHSPHTLPPCSRPYLWGNTGVRNSFPTLWFCSSDDHALQCRFACSRCERVWIRPPQFVGGDVAALPMRIARERPEREKYFPDVRRSTGRANGCRRCDRCKARKSKCIESLAGTCQRCSLNNLACRFERYGRCITQGNWFLTMAQGKVASR